MKPGMMMKMGLRTRNMIVRVFLTIKRRLTGKRILIIKKMLIIKMVKIRNRLKFKIRRAHILRQEKGESKKENRER
jgi:hypothetical protein